jgi:gliding motility-associated-like protein
LVDEHQYTYITYLKDNCGGLSPESNIARSVLLKAELKENDIIKYNPMLTWTPYNYWFTGVDHYKVFFKLDSTNAFINIGQVDASKPLSFYHKNADNQQFQYCYKVVAYQKDSSEIFSESNTICLETSPRLFAPNVFTINGDNLNEQFVLGGVFIDIFHIDIYNRYGERVFTSDDMKNSWDGTVNGRPCAPDVYVYLAEGTGRRGQRITLKGNVTLLR